MKNIAIVSGRHESLAMMLAAAEIAGSTEIPAVRKNVDEVFIPFSMPAYPHEPGSLYLGDKPAGYKPTQCHGKELRKRRIRHANRKQAEKNNRRMRK
jgi:hypothetical protein